MKAELKGLDPTRPLKLIEAFPQIGHKSKTVLIPVLRRLGQELHHNPGHGRGDIGLEFFRRGRHLRNVGVDDIHGVF
ncbi:hypothetical protein ES708_12987 [subsurface metagenome]